MADTSTYFGGAPRFNSANTFLGTKVEALELSSQPADELVATEQVLGKSGQARYSAVVDRMRSGSFAVPAALDPNTSQLTQSDALVAGKMIGARASVPENFTMPKDINDAIKAYQPYSKDGDKLVEEYFGYSPSQTKIPMTNSKARTPLGSKIVASANEFIGQNNYDYGTWDCSAFTRTAVKNATGVDISRSTSSQMNFFKKQDAWATDIRQARPGDVLYFRSGASPSGRHTGIYIGNGLMVDNAGVGKPIKVRSIAGRRLIGVGRATALQ